MCKSWEENIATGSVLFQEWLKSNDYMPLQRRTSNVDYLIVSNIISIYKQRTYELRNFITELNDMFTDFVNYVDILWSE